ncbi:MAG: hypothetical protein ACKO96_13960 [Flammeovirgaceae bacterium]
MEHTIHAMIAQELSDLVIIVFVSLDNYLHSLQLLILTIYTLTARRLNNEENEIKFKRY